MPVKWIKTNYPGVRYYEHLTRKHGIKKDRYFAIRYQKGGKRKEEGLGWASEKWNADKAALKLAELKEGHTKGGPTRLSEQRKQVKVQKDLEDAAKKKRAIDNITFSKIFTEHYFPQAKRNKAFKTYDRERGLFENWLKPVIGRRSLKNIAPIHIEKIKQNMRNEDRAPRSIAYALTLIRQVYNFASENNLFKDINPVASTVKKSINACNKTDNKRVRFLTPLESDKLLKALKIESTDVWEQALISLHTGLRASEIFRLRWIDIKLYDGIINVKGYRNTKTKTRFAFMTQNLKDLFSHKKAGKEDDLIYTNDQGEMLKEVSRVFERVVKGLGLNEGATDKRDRVVFHTLRHTYASMLVQAGESLYVVQERMGHSTLAMTERYSHLAPENALQTVQTIEKIFQKSNDEDATVVNLDDRKK